MFQQHKASSLFKEKLSFFNSGEFCNIFIKN
jgi:hypothetical protein